MLGILACANALPPSLSQIGRRGLEGLHSLIEPLAVGKRSTFNVHDINPNGSTFLWVIEDTYAGKTFFE